MSEFSTMLDLHKKLIDENLTKIANEITTRKETHDCDKINNDEIFKIYDEHFPKLKKIKYASDEYYKYERDNFELAHKLHAQSRHHFYSKYNKTTEPNLIDLMEAVVDIYCSNIQYSNEADPEIITKHIMDKSIGDIDIEQYILNTIIFLKGELNE